MKRTKEIVAVIRLVSKKVKEFAEPYVVRKRDPFRVLISCILSLRTRDETTRGAGRRLFAVADTPKSISQLGAARIAKLIYPVGFYKTKAKRIKTISRTIWKQYNSKVPEDFEKLLEFKGVGRKTANIVMAYGFGKPAIPVDVHVNRIPNRLGWVKTKTPEQTEMALRKIIPRRYWLNFNNDFVKFGQNVCKPIRPHCWVCPITKYCRYYKNIVRPGIHKPASRRKS